MPDLKKMKNWTLSYSGVKQLLESVEHFIMYKQRVFVPTAAMQFGTAYDCYLLETEKFESTVKVIECKTKEVPAKVLTEYRAKNPHCAIITQKEFETMRIMKAEILTHPVAKKFLQSKKKKAQEWIKFDFAGFKMNGRTDIFIDTGKRKVIVDLKTCASASIQDIEYSIQKYKYYIQAAFYMMPFIEAGESVDFYFMFQEKTAPYNTQVIQLDSTYLEYGMNQIQLALEKWKKFLDSRARVYTGYSDRIVTVSLPGFLPNKSKNLICDTKIEKPKPKQELPEQCKPIPCKINPDAKPPDHPHIRITEDPKKAETDVLKVLQKQDYPFATEIMKKITENAKKVWEKDGWEYANKMLLFMYEEEYKKSDDQKEVDGRILRKLESLLEVE